jgi:hypothetical protein
VFIIANDLSDGPRSVLVMHLTVRGVSMQQYSWHVVRPLLIELLCTPKSALHDMKIRPRSDYPGNRSLCVLEGPGEIEGYTGYLAEDDYSGEVGVLDGIEDSFWVFDDIRCA